MTNAKPPTTPQLMPKYLPYATPPKVLVRWLLDDCDLLVTWEPCVMRAGSLIDAHVRPLVSGAADLRLGATGSLYDVCSDPQVNHNSAVKYGVLAPESQAQLQELSIQERDK